MTMLEALVGIIALALAIGVFVLVRLAARLGRAADDVGFAARRTGELMPAAHDLIDSAHSELKTLRSLTRSATDVADDVRAVTGHASAVTSHVLRGFESEVANRYMAIFAGLRAGVGVLRQVRGGNGSPASHPIEDEDSNG